MIATSIAIAFFVICSIWLLYVSRRSLRVVGSHGFYRFFAWEAILGLVLVNIHAWFSDPSSFLQIISWIFLVLSLVLLGLGVKQLRLMGKADGRRREDDLMVFEKTSALVTSGIYRYIRHPLYSSLLLLAWGAFLKDVTWYSVCLVIVATLFLVATAKADEGECIRYFGPAYEEYMKATEMFIPFLF